MPIVSTADSFGASADNGVAYPLDGRGAEAWVSASSVGLKVMARAGIPAQPMLEPFPPMSVAAGGTALMRFDDVVFSSHDGEAGAGLIPVSLNLAIDGSFSLLQSGASDTTARGGVSVSYGLGVPGVRSTAIPASIGTLQREIDRGESGCSQVGIFSVLGASDTWEIGGLFQTPTFMVPIDTPLLLTVMLNASASAVTRDGATVEALTAFDHSLRFPRDGPVFKLPAGYTVDSLRAGIAGNVSAVPLPPTLWLFAAGLAAIAARRGVPAVARGHRIPFQPSDKP
jgi:hypothetical protein